MASAHGIRAGAAYVELFADDSRLARGLKRAQKRLKAFGRASREIGSRLMAAAGVAAMPLLAGVKIFADFEAQMANVATMLDEPEKHMDAFRKGVRDMSVEFGESTETLTGGLYDILSASIPAAKALDVLAVAAKAGKAGISDTATAADAITTVLNAYGLSADKAGDVSDWLFSVVKRGKTTFAELAPSIGTVATIASSAGVSLDEVGASLATMTRNGVQTGAAVTALNSIIATFLKPTAEAAEYAKELGFEMSSATLESEGLAGVFKRISQLPADAVAKLFPNIRALKGVLPALKNMQGFGEDMAAMAGRAGATDKAFAKIAKTLSFAFAQVKQAGVAALAAVGEALSDTVGRAVAFSKRWLKYVRELVEKNQALVVAAAKVIAIVGLVGGALVAAGTAASMIAFAFGGFATILGVVGSALGLMISIIGAVLSPVAWVVAAVVGLGAVILYVTGAGGKALDWLGEKFRVLGAQMGALKTGICRALAAGDIGLAADILWKYLKMKWQEGIHALTTMWIGLKQTVLDVWTQATYGMAMIAAEAWANLQISWLEVTSFLTKAWIKFVNSVFDIWNKTQDYLAKRWIEFMHIFDKTIDVKAVFEQIDDSAKGRDKTRAEETKRELGRERERVQNKTDEIEQERKGTRDALSEEAAKEKADRDKAYAKDRDESDTELADAKQELADALEDAADAAEHAAFLADVDAQMAAAEKELNALQEAQEKKLKGAGDATDAAAAKLRDVDVAGAFSAAAVNRMGLGSGVADRTAKATEETAKNTKDIKRKIDDAQAAFV